MRSLMIPFIVACSLFIAGADPAGSPDQGGALPATPALLPPTAGGSGPASCLVKVRCDPLVLPLDANTLNLLLNTTGVVQEAAREVFGETRPDFRVQFSPLGAASASAEPPRLHREPLRGGGGGGGGGGVDGGGGRGGVGSRFGGGEQGGVFGSGMMPGMPMEASPSESTSSGTVVGVLTVETDVDRGAEKLMTAVCERLRKVLLEAHNAEAEQLQARVGVAEEEVNRSHKRLDQLYQQRRDREIGAGGESLARESIEARTQKLSVELQQLQMELAGMQARREAMQEQIAEKAANVSQTLGDNHPMIKAHKIRLDVLRKKLDQLETMHQAGQVSSTEVMDTKAAMAMAEGELQQQLEQAKSQAGGGQIRDLTNELAGVSVETTERRARAEFLQRELAKAKDLLAQADAYEIPVTMELPLSRQFYESARIRLEELQRQARAVQPPVVTVIGGP